MFKSFFDLSFIIKPFLSSNNSRTSFLSCNKMANIFCVLLIYMFAISIWFSSRPFSVITHEGIRRAISQNLDSTFTIPHSIFELSQINIFIRHILKSKTIFLTLSWKISFPISKIKCTTIIPESIFSRG